MADVLVSIASIQRHKRAMRRNSVKGSGRGHLAQNVRKHMLQKKQAELTRTKSKWVRKFRAQRDTWRIDRAERAAVAEAEAEAARQAAKNSKLQHVSRHPLPRVNKMEAMPSFWQPGWGRQSYCDFCRTPASPGHSYECMFCACVAHFDCVPRALRPTEQPEVMALVRQLMVLHNRKVARETEAWEAFQERERQRALERPFSAAVTRHGSGQRAGARRGRERGEGGGNPLLQLRPLSAPASRVRREMPLIAGHASAAGAGREKAWDEVHEAPMRRPAPPRLMLGMEDWVCANCLRDIKENHALSKASRDRDELARLVMLACVKMQAAVRARRAFKKFHVMRRAVCQLQARARGFWGRGQMQLDMASRRRPFKIRVSNASGLPLTELARGGVSPPNPFVHVGIVSGSNHDKQIFNFATTPLDEDTDPQWDETFLVPGADGNVTLVFTVIDKDGTGRHERQYFLGQAQLDLKGTDFAAKGGTWELPLTQQRIVPKEGDDRHIRLQDRFGYVHGRGSIHVEILALSNVDVMCGFLGEKTGMGSAKKWWCVLADGRLRLYKFFGHAKERHSITMSHVTRIEVLEGQRGAHSRGSPPRTIKLYTRRRLWVFEFCKRETEMQWQVRLNRAAGLDKGKSKHRRLQSGVTVGGRSGSVVDASAATEPTCKKGDT